MFLATIHVAVFVWADRASDFEALLFVELAVVESWNNPHQRESLFVEKCKLLSIAALYDFLIIVIDADT